MEIDHVGVMPGEDGADCEEVGVRIVSLVRGYRGDVGAGVERVEADGVGEGICEGCQERMGLS